MWDDEEQAGMPSIYLGQKAFVDAGHTVRFVYPGRQNRVYRDHGIELQEFKFRWPAVSERHIWFHRVNVKIYWWMFMLVATFVALRTARRMRPDVVYGHFFAAAPVAWLIGKLFGVPNITRMYGTFLYPWLQPFWKRMLKFEDVLAFKIPCAYLIVTNDGTRGDDCAKALRVPENRLKFWRNGIEKGVYEAEFDSAAFKEAMGIPRADKIILSLGRLVRWKGVDRLLAALPDVLKQCPDTSVLLVGDGEDRSRLEKMADTLCVRHKVKFVGGVVHQETSRYMNAADLFVSLYHLSNVGNPLLEALCCGKCIVTLSNGATPKLVRDGVTAILVDENRLSELPSVMVSLLKNDTKRACMGQAARKFAIEKLQTWPERLAMEVELIEQLVGIPGIREMAISGTHQIGDNIPTRCSNGSVSPRP